MSLSIYRKVNQRSHSLLEDPHRLQTTAEVNRNHLSNEQKVRKTPHSCRCNFRNRKKLCQTHSRYVPLQHLRYSYNLFVVSNLTGGNKVHTGAQNQNRYLRLLHYKTRKISQLELCFNMNWRMPATSVGELFREQEEEAAALSNSLDLFHRYCNYKAALFCHSISC